MNPRLFRSDDWAKTLLRGFIWSPCLLHVARRNLAFLRCLNIFFARIVVSECVTLWYALEYDLRFELNFINKECEVKTRLPANLRSTTRECVHLVTSGHVTKIAVTSFDPPWPKIPCYMQISGIGVIEGSLHCGNSVFDLFAPVTLTWTRWPSYTNMTLIPWMYTGCTNMNFLRQGVRKLSSDKQTDRHDQNYIQRRFAGGQK